MFENLKSSLQSALDFLGKLLEVAGNALRTKHVPETGTEIADLSIFRLAFDTAPDNGDLGHFYVSEQVTKEEELTFKGENAQLSKQTPLVKDLLKVKGVIAVILRPYWIAIRKVQVFSWQELRRGENGIDNILRRHLAPEEKSAG